jgi:hypothetical protein
VPIHGTEIKRIYVVILYKQTNMDGCIPPTSMDEILDNLGDYEFLAVENGQVMVHGWINIGGKSYHSILGTDRVESSKEAAMPYAEEVANCSFEKVSGSTNRERKTV